MKEASQMSLGHAALLMLSGMCIIGLIDNFVVHIAKYAGLWQFHALRAAMAIPLLIGLALLTGARILPQRWWAVGLRSALLASAMVIYFGAIPLMPIAVVVACLFTAPVFVLIFSSLFFGQKIGLIRIAAVALGMCGVLLILDPWQAVSWAMVLPVCAGALYAMNTITARRYCAEESTIAMLIAFFSCLGISGLIGMALVDGGMEAIFPLRGAVPITQPLVFWTAIQAVGSIIAVGLLTRAYQSADPSYLSVFEYSLLIVASFWAWVLFDETVGGQAWLGIICIVVSGVIILVRGRAQAVE